MKILNRLTIKHLMSNKRRTIVTIIGIILSTALMVGVGLLFSTMREASINEIKKNSGSHHVMVQMPKDKINLLDNYNIKEYSYSSSLGYSLLDGITNLYKPYVEVLSANSNYLNDLNIIDGKLPLNSDEVVVSKHLITNGEVDVKIGDTLKLNIGNRIDDFGSLMKENAYQDGEKLINTYYKEYKVVGIVERNNLEEYQNPGYNIYTINNDSNSLNVYITYKKVKDTYSNTKALANDLGYENIDDNYYKEIRYNDSLLYLYGISNYSNIIESMSSFLAIILSLISVACIIVIYNSFAISVMERKKQFGLFSSIGSTKRQLRYTVFYEAFIVGIIGIILGLLASFVGIGCVIIVINHLLPDIFGEPLRLVFYPLFIFIPVIFMVLTILISAYIPAKIASRITPIEAIRQNDDIKIKGKKLKTPKFITKLFGAEGDIAYKNMKRNKKKYRITIVSLFISIVLFISFSAIVKYGLETTNDFTGYKDYDFMININNSSIDKVNEIESNIKKYENTSYLSYSSLYLITSDSISYSDDFKEKYKSDNYDGERTVIIITLDNENYNNYKKSIGLKDDRPILINKYETIDYTSNSRKQIKIKPFNNFSSLNIFSGEQTEKHTLDNIYLSDTLPKGINSNDPGYSLTFIVSHDMFMELKKMNEENYDSLNIETNMDNNFLTIYLDADNYDELEKYLDTESDKGVNYYNIKEEMKTIYNTILVIKILLYGFISLVTLIGITSVLNTINTSISLRRKEFAMLRSMGLTPKGFNKMLFFESLLFGLKSLLYGIPVSLIIVYLLYNSSSQMVEFDNILIPWVSIITAIIGVFIIVLISMWYASKKIKKENILEALREENI